jgi:hypothetical protein
MTRTERSARKELRALIESAVAREADLPEGAARRIVNRILRQSGRLADIGGVLRAAEAMPPAAAAEVVQPAVAQPTAPAGPPPVFEKAFDHVFDPYAIGAVVTLQRLGADGLLERLSAISSVENLVSLATAQNLALRAGWSNADELRAAIVRCAEQRLDERRAAACMR